MKRSTQRGKPAESRELGVNSAAARFGQLDAPRQGMIRRFEGYASVTIPKICLPDGVNQNSTSLQHDWTSVGAMAVNHVTNKIVMALFQPGLPFFRLDPSDQFAKALAERKVTEDQLRASLVGGEQKALRILDQRAVRPKLHDAIRQLVVTGNTLLDLIDDDNPRVMGIKKFVVKRSLSGKVQEILTRERVLFDELDDDAQAQCHDKNKRGARDQHIDFYRWFKKARGKWTMTQWVDSQQLDASFDKTWTEAKFPVYPLVWDLADEHDYGTGLVEDYAGDFGTLSTLSEAEIKAAILASDYRWLANPAGVGDINEFKNSQTGDVIPGVATDLSLVAHVSTQSIMQIRESGQAVIQRIGRAFLMASAVTREAERVTAEEIRATANELETSLGGVYSRLAVDLQLPIAVWLLRQINVEVNGTQLIPTIVTGLAALSRNAEAQQLGLFLQSLAGVGALPPEVLKRLKLAPVISTLAGAYGITANEYVYTEDEVAAADQRAFEQQQQLLAQQALSQEGAKALGKEGQQ